MPRARRISGPARGAAAQRVLPGLRPLPVLGTIGSHAAKAGRSLPDSPLLDRLLRGRVWIGLLGVLLIGLVAINVSLLKLNAEAGRNAEKAKALRIQNADLRARVSRLRSSERLQSAGGELGLQMPAAGQVRYLSARPGDGRRAARAVRSGGPLTAQFQAPALEIETAPVALAPAAPVAPIAPASTAPDPAATQAPVPQPAPGVPAGGAAQPPATAVPVTAQPSPSTGG